MTKRTYQPKKERRKRRHGFLGRMAKQKQAATTGSHVIRDRRRKGRKRVSV